MVGVDLKYPRYEKSFSDEFFKVDLRSLDAVEQILEMHEFDEIYQLAADMGGAGFVFTGENDADIMHNSASINLNILSKLSKLNFKGKIFILLLLVCIQNIIKLIQITLNVKKTLLIQRILIVSTVGKNYLVKDYFLLLKKIKV